MCFILQIVDAHSAVVFLNCQLKVAHLLVGGHNLLQLVNIGASQVGNLGLVLEEEEGRHGSDLRKQIDHYAVRVELLSSYRPCTLQPRPRNHQRRPSGRPRRSWSWRSPRGGGQSSCMVHT